MNEKENDVKSKADRIREKVMEVQENLEFLMENVPSDFEEYEKDLKAKAVCEHYFEKIIEGCTDLAFLIIREKKLEIPEDEESAFKILLRHSIIDSNLAVQMISAKGMRNIIAHEYGKIDDSRVYPSLSEEIENDVMRFIESIKKYLGLE